MLLYTCNPRLPQRFIKLWKRTFFPKNGKFSQPTPDLEFFSKRDMIEI